MSENTEIAPSSGAAVASEEYLDAYNGIQSDAFDTTSWTILLEEVEQGRGGTAGVIETFTRFLKQFPRAARVYGRLAEHLVRNNQLQAAAELLGKNICKLRHVELWMQYLKIMKRLIPKDHKDANHSAARKAYESAYEMALDNVGYSVESGPVWKDYIDYLKDFPDASMDPSRKREALRKAYQRALAVPMESLDELWKAYDSFERYAGEAQAKELLAEVEKKYLSAKTLHRDRKRLVSKIFFDRQAVPSTRSRQEMEQLDLWNKWIRYEKGNPDNLPTEAFKMMLQMVYEQCLCCMRFHPEVWLSLAKFEVLDGRSGIVSARNIFEEAIETLPNVAFLRIAYSETEEHYGSTENAARILDAAYEKLPSGLMFAVKQRFVRRRYGLVAARKFFSDSLSLRLDKKLGYEVYLSHAQLELDVNCAPEVAQKVLDLARSTYPTETATVQYIRLLTRILLRFGDVNKIRWAFQTVLGEGSSAAVTTVAASVTGPKSGGETAAGTGTAVIGLSLRDQVELWEDYLNAETILGLSGIDRLDILRGYRDAARQAYEDSERARHVVTGSAAVAAAEIASTARSEGMFEYSNELIERYSGITSSIPDIDAALSERSRSFGGRAPAIAPVEGSSAGRSRRWGSTATETQDTSGTVDDFGVPQILRSFINKLPPYMAPTMPDFDAFGRSLRGLVLPPRPMVEEEVAVGTKRSATGSEWLAGLGNDDDDAAGDDLTSATRDDIFRQRQRARLL